MTKNDLLDFLAREQLSFEGMIRSFNFWNALSYQDRSRFIRQYEQGKIPPCGHYGYGYEQKKRKARPVGGGNK